MRKANAEFDKTDVMEKNDKAEYQDIKIKII